MSSRVLTTLGVVLSVLGVTVAAAAAPVIAGTTAQAQPHSQQSQPPVEGKVDIDPSDLPGDGSESDPYEISNVSELQAMGDDLDANYELVSDIDASPAGQLNNGRGFDPVGGIRFKENTPSPFTGTLDGNNHTVRGLTVNRSNGAIGLFGVTHAEATVRHVRLTNIMITGNNDVGGLVGVNSGGTIADTTVSGTVTGNEFVGGVIGYNDAGTITNVTTSANVTGALRVGGLVGLNEVSGTITDSSASGSVNATAQFGPVGGLVGENVGSIQTATVSGTVTGDRNVGGLVGVNGVNGTITDATVSGTVTGNTFVGGVVGENIGSIQTATASGSVTGEVEVGGLVGENIGSIQTAAASGSVIGTNIVGGLVGLNDGNGTITDTRASGDVNGDSRVGGLVGFNFVSGTVRNAFAVGPVSGTDDVGGLVGNNSGKVGQSYFNTETTGQSVSTRDAGGLTTAEMQGQAAAENMALAFGETWQTVSGDYPELIAPQKTTNPSTNPFSAPVPGADGQGPPTDTDNDGKLEDVNGDGESTFDDVIALAFVISQTGQLTEQQRDALNINGEGDVDFDDVIALAFDI